MKKSLLIILVLFSLSFLVGSAWGVPWGETICVDPAGGGDYDDLQDALTYAGSSYTSTLIMVVQGTYTGNFSYSSSEGYDIFVYGGYTAGCASRVVNPANTVLDGNYTGTVLYLYQEGGDVTVQGFTIRKGGTSDYGGGIYAESWSDSGDGGAINITDNIITGNRARRAAGVWAESWSDYGDGGAVTLTNNVITDNEALDPLTTYFGGAMVSSYSGLGSGTGGVVTLTNNIIAGNSASSYGGVSVYSSSDVGTAGEIILSNNIIVSNSADYVGGVYVEAYSNYGDAGTITFTNNTVTDNDAPVRGGVYFYTDSGQVNFYNNISWGNANEDVYLEGNGAAYAYNNYVQDWSGDIWDGGGPDHPTNINDDPLLTSDYHLRTGSPCIDTGNNSAPELPSTDIDGDARPINTTVDIGADEYDPSQIPYEEMVKNDFNSDGISDIVRSNGTITAIRLLESGGGYSGNTQLWNDASWYVVDPEANLP